MAASPQNKQDDGYLSKLFDVQDLGVSSSFYLVVEGSVITLYHLDRVHA